MVLAENFQPGIASAVNSYTQFSIQRDGIPITSYPLDGVKQAIDRQYFHNFGPRRYKTDRGTPELLMINTDYAKLPDLPDMTSMDFLKSLKPGNTLLDVGCGSGDFLDGLSKINNGLVRYGFDSKEWPGQKKDIFKSLEI